MLCCHQCSVVVVTHNPSAPGFHGQFRTDNIHVDTLRKESSIQLLAWCQLDASSSGVVCMAPRAGRLVLGWCWLQLARCSLWCCIRSVMATPCGWWMADSFFFLIAVICAFQIFITVINLVEVKWAFERVVTNMFLIAVEQRYKLSVGKYEMKY